MSPQPDPIDLQVIKKRSLLRLFYVLAFCSAVAFGLGPLLNKPIREISFVLSFLGASLALVTLYRFLSLIDQFEREYTRGALLFAFVALVGALVIEAFIESFGFGHLPAYGNVVLAIIFWSVGLAYSSWEQHWRRGYEE